MPTYITYSKPVTLADPISAAHYHATAHREAGTVTLPAGESIAIETNHSIHPTSLPVHLRPPTPTLAARVPFLTADGHRYLAAGTALIAAGVPVAFVRAALWIPDPIDVAQADLAAMTFVELPAVGWHVLDDRGNEHGHGYDTLDQAVAWAWTWLTEY